MKRKTTLLLAGLVLLLGTTRLQAQQTTAGNAPSNAIANELILQLEKGVSPSQLSYLFPPVIDFQEIVFEAVAPDWNIYKAVFPESGNTAPLAIKLLQASPQVRLVQYNHKLDKRTDPDDPDYGLQWGLNNSGAGGTADADVDAPEAWDVTTGGLTTEGDTIVLAVIDEGFDLNHEDLNFWKNRGEIPGDGLDNDGNGFIDDYLGWNGHDSSATFPMDNHGTHVCGIAGARGNNDIGISGVNWELKILPIFIEIEEADAVAAYYYVYKMRQRYDQSGGTDGAFIVATNSSFGIDFAQPEDYPLWCSLYDTLGSIGILSAAATINSNIDIDLFGDVPTGCASEFLLAVTNTDNDDELNSAGYGVTSIDLAAPGTNIYSTFVGDLYGLLSGTSMSTPHVAGTIALLYSAACPQFISDYKYDPASMALLMKEYVLEGVDPIADLVDKSVTEGRLNIFNSIQRLEAGYCATTGIAPTDGVQELLIFPNPAKDDAALEISLTNPGTYSLSLLNSLGQVVQSHQLSLSAGTQVHQLDLRKLPAGIYHVVLRDKEGNTHSSKLNRF